MNQNKMLRSPFGHMRRNAVAYLALFVALGGTSAYAANEWTGANIVDETLTGADVKNGSVASRDVANESLAGADVLNGTLAGADVLDSSLTGADVAPGSLHGTDIADGSIVDLDIANESLTGGDIKNDRLTGDDINESTLNLPQTPTTATFAGVTGGVRLSDSLTKVAAKTLPAGSYAITATANLHSDFPFNGDRVTDMACELRNGTGFIGGAADRRVVKSGDNEKVSLSMNGGAQVPAGGGEVSLWCLSQLGGAADYGQMMIIRLDSFS